MIIMYELKKVEEGVVTVFKTCLNNFVEGLLKAALILCHDKWPLEKQ
jgi:hypothetical protein